MQRLTTLYRPVGRMELDLIGQSGWRRFPPRLPEQPIFYPVLTEAYATQIARDWNARDGQQGYVTRFAIDAEYIERFEPQCVGGRIHLEYWIPAHELHEFNNYIVGLIEAIAAFGDD
jgi:hypothetical protein